MRKLVTFILLGGFVLGGLGVSAAEAKFRCKAKRDLPGLWYVSIVLFAEGAPYNSCNIVYSRKGGIDLNRSSCTDAFGTNYFPAFGGGISLNRACQVSGQVVMTTFGQGGQPNQHPILRFFQPGQQVSVVVDLDNLRMVRDKLSVHGSGKVTYAGPGFPTPTPRSDTYGALIDAIKK